MLRWLTGRIAVFYEKEAVDAEAKCRSN